jgi:hypothetical protein
VPEHFPCCEVVEAKAASMPAIHSCYQKAPIMLFTEIVSALGLGILVVDVEETIGTYL